VITQLVDNYTSGYLKQRLFPRGFPQTTLRRPMKIH